MELVYATNIPDDAKRLAVLFEGAGMPAHVSGEYAASLPGFFAARTPGSVGVRLASATDLARAREIMLASGFLSPPTLVRRPWHEPLWVKISIAAAVAVIAAAP